jgi:WD40 repeat protein
MSLDYLLKGHKAQVFAVGFTPEGILYSGSEDGTIRLWDLRTHKASQCVVCESAVIDVDFMDNLLYCASGNSIYTYDLRMIPSNTKLIRTFVNKQTFDIDEISAFKCHHKASYYAVADDNGGLYIYYTKTEQLKNIRNRKGHTNDVSSIIFRPHSLYDMVR